MHSKYPKEDTMMHFPPIPIPAVSLSETAYLHNYLSLCGERDRYMPVLFFFKYKWEFTVTHCCYTLRELSYSKACQAASIPLTATWYSLTRKYAMEPTPSDEHLGCFQSFGKQKNFILSSTSISHLPQWHQKNGSQTCK